jgi:hypothetical protein
MPVVERHDPHEGLGNGREAPSRIAGLHRLDKSLMRFAKPGLSPFSEMVGHLRTMMR